MTELPQADEEEPEVEVEEPEDEEPDIDLGEPLTDEEVDEILANTEFEPLDQEVLDLIEGANSPDINFGEPDEMTDAEIDELLDAVENEALSDDLLKDAEISEIPVEEPATEEPP